MSPYQLLLSFVQHESLPFAKILTEDDIQRCQQEVGVNTEQNNTSDTKYTTAITLWAFLSQVLHAGPHRSCAAAVARIITLCVLLNREPPSADTGAYCRARERLPLPLIQKLTLHIADEAERQTPERWLWKGRHVHLVDGTTLSAPDTPTLQKKFPQSKSQKPGLGFPILRLVVMMSLATAMVTGLKLGPYKGKKTGETALFRELFERLSPEDVVLADRYYCSYFMVALLRELNISVVFRLNANRSVDFARGRRLGNGDHVVKWTRPPKPEWMTDEEYDRMPQAMEVRELSVQVSEPWFRTQSLVVATTLLDAKAYPKEDLGELYHRRWLIELDIRSLKVSLQLDVLRTKSPLMVEKEIWVAMLAYNLLRRSLMQAASLEGELSPRQLSFAAAVQATSAVWMVALTSESGVVSSLMLVQLRVLGKSEVGDRPGRVEPRANKRRPKPMKLLMKPRAEARAELLAGQGTENP